MSEPFVVNVADAPALSYPGTGSFAGFEDPMEPFPDFGSRVHRRRGGPCWILMVGARGPDVRSHYPMNETAANYGTSAPESTGDSKTAYADWPNEAEPARLPWPRV